MVFTRKDEVAFNPKPMLDYLDGDSSLYLCNPIEVDGSYACLYVPAYSDVIGPVEPTTQIIFLILSVVAYHLLMIRLMLRLFR